MEILCFYNTKRDRKRDFMRFQISRDDGLYIFEELLCHQFGEEVASEEIDRQEFENENEARATYERRLGAIPAPPHKNE